MMARESNLVVGVAHYFVYVLFLPVYNEVSLTLTLVPGPFLVTDTEARLAGLSGDTITTTCLLVTRLSLYTKNTKD